MGRVQGNQRKALLAAGGAWVLASDLDGIGPRFSHLSGGDTASSGGCEVLGQLR